MDKKGWKLKIRHENHVLRDAAVPSGKKALQDRNVWQGLLVKVATAKRSGLSVYCVTDL